MDTQLIVSVPYASAFEKRKNARYRWTCSERGNVGFVILQRTLSGRGLFDCQGIEHEVPAGHAFVSVVPEDAEYRYPADSKEPWAFDWINFYGKLAIDFWTQFRKDHGPVIPLEGRSIAGSALTRLIRSVEQRSFVDPFEASEQGYQFWMLLQRQLFESQRATPGTREPVLQYCRQQYHIPITVKELAAQAGMSREHFTRRFRTEHGISPAAYLRERRLEIAREMIATTDVPLRDIALRCGFSSPRQLTVQLRQEKKAPPMPTSPQPDV